VAVAGDGVQALVRLCFDLALPPGGTVLLEEPEAYQHPKAIYQSARAIVAAARRGVQVVLATHSLELMDAILGELRDEELDAPAFFSVHGLYLRDGELGQVRYDGRRTLRARERIGEDLR
jgi:AAA15 family ATPase/GTPase